MKTIRILLPLCAVVLLLAGCKPTEQNYKSAYDVAMAKRIKAEEDPELQIPGMTREGAPKLKVIDGDSIWYRTEPLSLADGWQVVISPFNVAIAAYKMPANANSQAKALKEEGFDSFVLKNNDTEFYVVSGSYDTIDEAAKHIHEYRRKYPGSLYIGLPEGPTIEIPSSMNVNIK